MVRLTRHAGGSHHVASGDDEAKDCHAAANARCLASRPPVLLGVDEVRLNEPRPDSA
jgi:hypothetical protein